MQKITQEKEAFEAQVKQLEEAKTKLEEANKKAEPALKKKEEELSKKVEEYTALEVFIYISHFLKLNDTKT